MGEKCGKAGIKCWILGLTPQAEAGLGISYGCWKETFNGCESRPAWLSALARLVNMRLRIHLSAKFSVAGPILLVKPLERYGSLVPQLLKTVKITVLISWFGSFFVARANWLTCAVRRKSAQDASGYAVCLSPDSPS